MPETVVGNITELIHENGDVKTTFPSGLQKIERTYFCAETYADTAEEILVEGYSPDDIDGFNLYPTPIRRSVGPGILDYQCDFYGLTTKKSVKSKLNTVQTSVRLIGALSGTSTIITRTLDVLADVWTYYYAISSKSRINIKKPPKATLENFTFLDPRVSVVGNQVKLVELDADTSTPNQLLGTTWVTTGIVTPVFRIEDVSEETFGVWKESTVSWRAGLTQRITWAV